MLYNEIISLGSDDSQRRLHSTLGLTTFALYSATAFLSFTAQPKEETALEPAETVDVLTQDDLKIDLTAVIL